MRTKSAVLTGVGVVVLLTTSSMALYYRSQAVFFQQEYGAAALRIKQMVSAASLEPKLSAPRMESARKAPEAARNAVNREAPRREQETQDFLNEQAAPPAEVPAVPRSADSGRNRRRASDWMEIMKTNDPQRYAEFQQRRQESQQNMQNAWGQVNSYFLNRDTSKMSQADQEEYNTMLSLLSQTAALSQQMQDGLPSDLRQQVSSTLRSNVVALAPLLESERNREYYDAAVAMGHNAQDAAAMVTYINQITSNTSIRTILPSIRGRGMFGGGPSSPRRAPAPAP